MTPCYKKFSISKIGVAILFLLISYTVSFGQISQELFTALPDSVRPKDRHHLTLNEAADVTNATFKLENRSESNVAEIDSLVRLVRKKYVSIKDTKDRLHFLAAVCRHMYNSQNLYSGAKIWSRGRSSEYLSSNDETNIGLDYSNIWIKELDSHAPDNYKDYYTAYGVKAFFQIQQDEALESFHSYQTSLNYAKKSENDFQIGQAFIQLSFSYDLLGLPKQAIIYSDSAQYFFQKLKKDSQQAKLSAATLIWTKQRAYLGLFLKQPELQYAADTIRTLHEDQVFDAYTKGRRRASSFIMLAGVNFHQKKYKEAVASIDSAEKTFSNLPLLILWEDAMIYKGLSLIYLGQEAAGLALLKLLDFQNIHTTAIPMALEVLISRHKSKGNLNEVAHYQDLLINHNQKKHRREMLGKMLEIEQQYNVSARDYQILQLTEQQKRNRWIALFIGLIGIAALSALWIRYRNNRAKTSKLLDQIKQETALELVKVEEANALERKRLGQELHDGLASSIAVAVRYLKGRVSHEVVADERAHLLAISNTLEESYNITRSQSNRLFMEDNSRQFCERLEEKTKLFFADTNIDFDFTGEISGIAISSDVKTTILMVAQEAITNIIKHANASEASILLYYDLDSIVLQINDNGKGIPNATGKRGMGLKSMENRVAAVGGNIKITANKPTGTILTITMPLPPESMENFD